MNVELQSFLPLLAGFLAILTAVCAGATGAWVLLGTRVRQAAEAAKAEAEAGAIALRERLDARERQLLDLRSSLGAATEEIARLREGFRMESEKRATAEEKNSRIPELENLSRTRDIQLAELRGENTDLREKLSETAARLADERLAAEEKLAVLNEARAGLADAFKALSADALRSNNRSFLELAKAVLEKFQDGAKNDLEYRQKSIGELVKPLKESLQKVDDKIGEIEKARTTAYVSLNEQIKSLADCQNQLRSETSALVQALRAPCVRGRWGEIQLKRVVELAGMVEYCDFAQQETATGDGGRLRPDMIVRLPNRRNVVVDSKAPLQAYLEALEARDDRTRTEKLKDHARQIRTHLSQLSSKAYWDQFRPAPEFAVLFLPGETFFQRGPGAGPRPDRVRGRPQGDPGDSDDTHRPLEGRRLWMAPGTDRGKRQGDQRTGSVFVRPHSNHGGAFFRGPQGIGSGGRRLQQDRGFHGGESAERRKEIQGTRCIQRE